MAFGIGEGLVTILVGAAASGPAWVVLHRTKSPNGATLGQMVASHDAKLDTLAVKVDVIDLRQAEHIRNHESEYGEIRKLRKSMDRRATPKRAQK